MVYTIFLIVLGHYVVFLFCQSLRNKNEIGMVIGYGGLVGVVCDEKFRTNIIKVNNKTKLNIAKPAMERVWISIATPLAKLVPW